MRDTIRDGIVSRILDGGYPPGMRLKELDLAREFNVSQAPVREALRELETLGLVKTERYRGTHVHPLDLVELREAYILRLIIEQASARAIDKPSPADLKILQDELDLMSAAATRKKRTDDYMESVLRFHRKIVEMSGNRLFLETWQSMAWGIRARIMAKRIGLICTYTQTRETITKALSAGEGELAATLLAEITHNLLQRLDQVIARERPQGNQPGILAKYPENSRR
ncbi:MAG: GntR family transcriptional regulator [Stenotrophobium sp.]